MAFNKGMSGNPGGRKPGQLATAGKLRKALEGQAEAVLQVLVDAALGGDVQAAKAIVDKCIPNLKPQAVPVQIMVGATLPESGANVVTATLGGEIPPDVGAALIKALAEQGKLVELQEMQERLQRIEKQLEARR